MTRRLPLYASALFLLTAALYGLELVPPYVSFLVLAAALLLLAGGIWREGRRV